MRRLGALLALFCALAVMAAPAARAAGQARSTTGRSNQVVIAVLGNLSLSEARTGPMPYLRSLIQRSGVGLANTLGVGKAEMDRSSATIGAGARAETDALLEPAMNVGEPYEGGTASEAYVRRNGYSDRGYAVVDVGMAALDRDNMKLPYHMVPGALGEAIARSGGANAVFGNADTSMGFDPASLHRESVYIAMDGKGRVRYGDVGKTMMKRDPVAPFGLVTETDRLIDGYLSVSDKARLVVLDFGDISRAERFRAQVAPRVAGRQRLSSLRRADEFLSRLVPNLAPRTTLVVVSPVGPEQGGANSMTPIVFNGPGMRPGMLTSPVTHRVGLINASDIAPTLLRSLGLPVSYIFLGTPTTSDGAGGSTAGRLDVLQALYDRASAEAAVRGTVMSILVLLVSIIFVGVVAFVFSPRISPRAMVVSKWLMVFIVSSPLASYLMWLVYPATGGQARLIAVFVALILLIPTMALSRAGNSAGALARVSAATALFIAVDQVVFRGRLVMSTFYGYSPVDGARYYGLGNEGWAVLVGALLVATALSIDRHKVSDRAVRWGVPVLFGGAVAIIGFPTLGANAGGVIGGTAAFAAAYLQLRDNRIGVKQAAIIILAIVLALTAFTGYDLLQPAAATTHIGRSARLIAGKNGLTELILLLQRKTLSNLKIMMRTEWSYVLLLILGAVALLRWKPTGLFAETLRRQPGLAAALTGGLVGGFAGLLTEDSGVVIPAMIMMFVGAALTVAMLETKFELQSAAGPLDSA